FAGGEITVEGDELRQWQGSNRKGGRASCTHVREPVADVRFGGLRAGGVGDEYGSIRWVLRRSEHPQEGGNPRVRQQACRQLNHGLDTTPGHQRLAKLGHVASKAGADGGEDVSVSAGSEMGGDIDK